MHMPFSDLNPDQQRAFKARLVRRGLKLEQLPSEVDVVVAPSARVVLSGRPDSFTKPVVRRPGSVEEMRQWLGIPERASKSQLFKSNHLHERTALLDMVERSGLNKVRLGREQTLTQAISGNVQAQHAFNALARAAVLGSFDISGLKPLYLYKEISSYVQATPLLSWSFVNVRIKAGGALVFDPPGPHTFVAHSLVIEPGGKIITNRTTVSFDCESIEIL
jgi:hypothetical protein